MLNNPYRIFGFVGASTPAEKLIGGQVDSGGRRAVLMEWAHDFGPAPAVRA
jgi:hypothetical protein